MDSFRPEGDKLSREQEVDARAPVMGQALSS